MPGTAQIAIIVDVLHRLDAGPVPAAPVGPDEVLDAQGVQVILGAAERQPAALAGRQAVGKSVGTVENAAPGDRFTS